MTASVWLTLTQWGCLWGSDIARANTITLDGVEFYSDVARREAIEEAGLIVKRTKPVLSFLASPGGTSERSSIMVGEVDATTASGIHGLADENEDIRVHVVSREQAYQWVEEGKIDNAASVIALQWLQLHHQALKNEWA